jgi:hypothetical protein
MSRGSRGWLGSIGMWTLQVQRAGSFAAAPGSGSGAWFEVIRGECFQNTASEYITTCYELCINLWVASRRSLIGNGMCLSRSVLDGGEFPPLRTPVELIYGGSSQRTVMAVGFFMGHLKVRDRQRQVVLMQPNSPLPIGRRSLSPAERWCVERGTSSGFYTARPLLMQRANVALLRVACRAAHLSHEVGDR